MVNYANGKIYKIEPKVEHEDNYVYIGSTAQVYLSTRLAQHINQYKRKEKHKRSSCKIFDKYGVDNCKITLIELYPCETKNELFKREGHYQREAKTCVNIVRNGRTKEEFLQLNKQRLEKYKANHKEEVIAYHIKYNKDNRETILKGKKAHYEANKERLLKQQKEFRVKNRDIIRARNAEKITCECGCLITRCNIIRHRKQGKHKEEMEKQNNLNLQQ